MRKRFVFFVLLPLTLTANAPDSISFAAGAFDVLRSYRMTAQLEMECKLGSGYIPSPFSFLFFRPLFGFMATVNGSFYVYGGINFDLVYGPLVIAPGFAAGWYGQGSGKDLGYPLEFRSGVELAWRFLDESRLGVHFYHLSNASLGKRNPGEESFVLFYDIPIRKGFPFK